MLPMFTQQTKDNLEWYMNQPKALAPHELNSDSVTFWISANIRMPLMLGQRHLWYSQAWLQTFLFLFFFLFGENFKKWFVIITQLPIWENLNLGTMNVLVNGCSLIVNCSKTSATGQFKISNNWNHEHSPWAIHTYKTEYQNPLEFGTVAERDTRKDNNGQVFGSMTFYVFCPPTGWPQTLFCIQQEVYRLTEPQMALESQGMGQDPKARFLNPINNN